MNCPICKKPIKGEPAISRRDNKTEICSECGIREAEADFVNQLHKEYKARNNLVKKFEQVDRNQLVKDLEDLAKRLQMEYSDGVKFEQQQKDRYAIIDAIEIIDNLSKGGDKWSY